MTPIPTETLARLNRLPKYLAAPERDLAWLARHPPKQRDEWVVELAEASAEYVKLVRDHESDQYLEGNIALSLLKLAVTCDRCGEPIPTDLRSRFSPQEHSLMTRLEEYVMLDRLSPEELAESVAPVDLARSAAELKALRSDTIAADPSIAGDVVLGVRRVIRNRLMRIDETVRLYVSTIGAPAFASNTGPVITMNNMTYNNWGEGVQFVKGGQLPMQVSSCIACGRMLPRISPIDANVSCPHCGTINDPNPNQG
jgi:hypothetical protein